MRDRSARDRPEVGTGPSQQQLPVGSGAIESAHRHVLQKRMKLAGQHWDPARADRLARLRALLATADPKKVYQSHVPKTTRWLAIVDRAPAERPSIDNRLVA